MIRAISKRLKKRNDYMGINLKHYDDYSFKLKRFAKAMGITVTYTSEIDCAASYQPHVRRIKIDSELPQSEEVAALLHELGHAIDDAIMIVNHKRHYKATDKAYPRYYAGKGTKKDALKVLLCERRAWKYGRAIAKRLDIRLGVWYDEFMLECLEAYAVGS